MPTFHGDKMKIKTIATVLLLTGFAFASDKKPAEKTKAKGAKTASAKVDLVKGKKVFETYCFTCHGSTGMGDGVAAAALNPKPRNFTDVAYMTTRTDEQLKKVIVEGGEANGLSQMMAPWGTTLKPDEVANVLGYVRGFAKK
jgi:mono/diheme cytochrome c family protein